MKEIRWVGDSRERLRGFPLTARRKIGQALNFAQEARRRHATVKPLRGIGSGIREIVARADTSTYRAVYTVNIGERIYVLHAFQKKSSQGIGTPKREIDLIKQRLKMAQWMETNNE